MSERYTDQLEEVDISEWLTKHRVKLTFNDFKLYFTAAFKRLDSKIIILEIIMGIFSFVLGAFFGDVVPAIIRHSLLLAFALIGLVLVITVIVRANSNLLFAVKRLVGEVSEKQLLISRLRQDAISFKALNKTYIDLYYCNANLYGVSFDETRIHLEIDKDGSATADYHLSIRATKRKIQAIEKFTYTSYEINFDKEKLGLVDKIVHLKNGEQIFLSTEITEKSNTRINWKLKATPEFPMGVPVPYSYKSVYGPKVFSMSVEELLEVGQGFEWLAKRISYPTNVLKMTVRFPEGYHAQEPDFDVWYTDNVKIRNDEEYDRIKRNDYLWETEIIKGRLNLELKVIHPLVGLHYVIRWMPASLWFPD
ncbi:hypothetical protein ACFLZW_05335 [Chloroflexota bacterium]